MTTTDTADDLKVFVRVGPYNVNPETAIDKASVISHEYGHSLGLPDFYSTGSRETYGDWNLMATDKSQNMDVFGSRSSAGSCPRCSTPRRTESGMDRLQAGHRHASRGRPPTARRTRSPRARTAGAQRAGVRRQAARPRSCIDPAKFDTGDKATPVARLVVAARATTSAARRTAGHNLDLALPELADLPAGTTVTLDVQVAAGTSSGTTTTASC